MRIANNKRKGQKKVQKCAPRASGSCGTFGNERNATRVREEASWPWNNIPPEALFVVSMFCFCHRGRGRHTASESAAHKALHINEAVTFLHLATPIVIVRFRFRRRPLALRHTTPHRDLPPTPAPPFSRRGTPRGRPAAVCARPVDTGAACVCACVRA